MAHLKERVPSAVALQPSLPPSVDVVLAKGMAKDPAARYPTCAAFIADLRAALSGDSVQARPIRDRRVPVAIGALGVGVAVLVGLILISTRGGTTGTATPTALGPWPPSACRRPRSAALRPRRRNRPSRTSIAGSSTGCRTTCRPIASAASRRCSPPDRAHRSSRLAISPAPRRAAQDPTSSRASTRRFRSRPRPVTRPRPSCIGRHHRLGSRARPHRGRLRHGYRGDPRSGAPAGRRLRTPGCSVISKADRRSSAGRSTTPRSMSRARRRATGSSCYDWWLVNRAAFGPTP